MQIEETINRLLTGVENVAPEAWALLVRSARWDGIVGVAVSIVLAATAYRVAVWFRSLAREECPHSIYSDADPYRVAYCGFGIVAVAAACMGLTFVPSILDPEMEAAKHLVQGLLR